MIVIIPARATSKRLPNKNFKKFFGRPIIEWVIDEVVKSELFDKVIISTDKEIQQIEYGHIIKIDNLLGAEIYLRKNPQYEQTVDDVVVEVLEHYGQTDYCVIYPTAYAVTAEHLLRGYGAISIGIINGEYGLDNGGFYYSNTKSQYEMPQVDINTMEDFIQAKLHALTLPCGRFK